MPNRNLIPQELVHANALLADIRAKLITLANGDDALHFAYRRKIAKELTYDERGKPMHRKMLRARKMGEQSGKCAACAESLPEKYSVLDRLDGMAGYTSENVRLICSKCDLATQAVKNYR